MADMAVLVFRIILIFQPFLQLAVLPHLVGCDPASLFLPQPGEFFIHAQDSCGFNGI